MEHHLYLLELFVETITFSSNLPEYPLAQDVLISGDMGQFLSLTVQPVKNLATAHERQKEIAIDCGQSSLFAITPDDLFSKINENPFQISLHIKKKHVASANLGWTKGFYTLAKNAENVASPAVMTDQFLLHEKGTERIMGDIKATVKLSFFGDRIHTSFQLVRTEQDKNNKYLVTGARGNAAFECQKIVDGGTSSSILPLTSLLTTPSKFSKHSDLENEEMKSIMALFQSNIDPKLSILPEEFNITISNVTNADKKTASILTFDIISLRERPEENKYIDLRIRGGSQGFIFEFEPNLESALDPITRGELLSNHTISTDEEEDESLTVEKINRMLCKNKDCPAAKKFKEFGIGPLANTKGLGCVYGEPSLPVTYGMSQTYGIYDEYGPYGLFSKPKKPSDPFSPKTDTSWAASCWKPKRHQNREFCHCRKRNCDSQQSPLRLNGGATVNCLIGGLQLSEQDEALIKHRRACRISEKPNWSLKNPNCLLVLGQSSRSPNGTFGSSPLRLKGGGVLDYDDIKSPFHECKEIMDQYDEVLRKYKKALGPCGKTTCPFAPNVAKESCKKMCQHDNDVYSFDGPLEPPQEEKPLEECQAPPKKVFPLKGACGSPKCAYAKYKHGLRDEDAEMELQYLPSAPSGKCGHPKCPYPVEPDLPPIHWDCPDPLPKGRCKNPDCPYLPKEIKCLNAVLAKGPCGNFNCPFAPPAPCSSPYCPFASKECPYRPRKAPSDAASVCDDPECLFAPKKVDSICDNSECPFAKKNPNPPCYVPPCGDNPCLPSVCPVNPYLQSLLAYFSLLGGRTCPHSVNTCPFQKEESIKNDECGKLDPNVCTKKPSPCYVPPESVCGNPDCPFSKEVAEKQNQNEVCENPGCPYSPQPPCYEKDDTCDNPECPFKTKPPCPVRNPCITAVPPCLDPFSYCMPLSICPDGVCPYQAQEMLQICFGGVECPYTRFAQTQPCQIEGKDLKKDKICENPECPYAQKGGGDKFDRISLPEGIEYTSGTRTDIDNVPCTKETCRGEGGGDLVCEECAGGSPDDEYGVEYKTDVRASVDLTPCTKKTCQSTGGKLVCDVCPCTGKMKKASLMRQKKRKKGKRGKYVYSIGDKYPGVHIGHKQCIMPAFNVPPKMGWLWNVHIPCMQLKPRRGWRPGAIAKTIAERIRKHREAQGLPMMEVKDLRKGKKGYGFYESGTSINVQPKPTLHIKKHDGCYWITMNPLKDPNTLVENENPYMDCSPLQFKITKNKENKEDRTNDEYKSCFCGDEENEESSSSDSELEIEFTPPAGIIHPERFKRKRNVVHCDTQYLITDFEKKSEKGSKKGGKKGKKGKKGGKKGRKKKK